MHHDKIAAIRRDYSLQKLTEEQSAAEPILQFDKWWQDALHAEIDEVNAMTLSTVAADGFPWARIVLLKGFDHNGFVFFTNYESIKGKQLLENPKASLVFFWKELERQVRVLGHVSKVSEAESTAYFKSRPEASQIGAWTSPQSRVIENRHWIDEQFNEKVKQLEGTDIQRPAYWGGYIVKPIVMEFWQGRPGRLHDRLQYSLQDNGNWKKERLAP